MKLEDLKTEFRNEFGVRGSDLEEIHLECKDFKIPEYDLLTIWEWIIKNFTGLSNPYECSIYENEVAPLLEQLNSKYSK